MERLGVDRAIASLLNDGVPIKAVVIDRNRSVAKMIRDKYKNISICHDLWHVRKGVGFFAFLSIDLVEIDL